METNDLNSSPQSAPTQTVVQPMATTNVAKVNSRVGFAAHVALAAVWILTYLAANALYAVIVSLLGIEKTGPAEEIVLLISLSVPLVPIFLFSNSRLNTMLNNNAGNIEDVNLKKQVRSSLRNATIIGVLFIAYKIYRILGIMFLSHDGDAVKSFISLVVYGSALGLVAYYSWGFYNKMRS